MAKTRLNNTIRAELTKFLEQHLDELCSKEAKKKDSTYELAKQRVLEDCAARWPERDLRVLKKYDCVETRQHISGVCPAGRHVTLNLRRTDALEQPKRSNVVHLFRAETAVAIDKYELAFWEWSERRREVRQDYDALIQAYRYIDDVIEVWPATQKILEGYLNAAKRSLPVALPEAALKRITKRNLGS